MTLLERLVCAIDFSETSDLALDVAISWSRRLDRPLLLVHVFDPSPVGPSSALPYPAWPTAAASKAIERNATKRMQDISANKLEGIEHDIEVVAHPSPPVGICETANATDLLIVGTQGKTGLERVVLGSVAERTVRYAPCPVLVIRGDIATEGFPSKVLVCTDFSDAALPALTLGGSVAKAFSSPATLLHARSKRSWKNQLEYMEQEEIPKAEASFREALDSLHAEHLPPPVRSAFVVSESVSDAIVRHAERGGADLVVLATHGRTGISRLALGSVAEHVTRHAHCPVLVARAESAD